MPHCTECVTDLDLLTFESILTTFKLSIVFRDRHQVSIEYWLEPKIKPPTGNLARPNR